MIEEFSITIKKVRKPKGSDLNQDIQIISQSLGLFTKRDKEKSCYRVFLELVKNKNGLSAEEITITTNLTRPTVIHHLKNLLDYNLIIKDKSKYKIKKESLNSLVDFLENEVNAALNELKEIAKDIDKEL